MALAGAAADAVGILQDKPTSGKLGAVQLSGPSRAVAGAAFAVGDRLATDASGRLVTAVATNPVLAKALEAAAAAGDIVEVDIDRGLR